MTKLEAVCDLLMPALRMMEPPDIKLSIEIDRVTQSLLVKGTIRRELGFAITTKAIENKTYLDQFKPCVETLINCLRQGEDYSIATRPPKDMNDGASAQE